MQIRVKLSSEPLIDYQDFCLAIAEAVCPTGEKGLQGIECVIGKIVTHYVRMPESAWLPMSSQFYHAWQSVLVSEDGRTLDQLLPFDQAFTVDGGEPELSFTGPSFKQIAEVPWPSALTDADRRDIAEVLPNLPPLRYPMSEEDRAAFMEAYFNTPNRPMLVPDLVTDATIKRRKAAQEAELRRHEQALLQEFEAGRLTPVNARHSPVATLMAGTFIPRAQAVLYLERHGLAYDDRTKSRVEKDVAPVCDNAIEVAQVSELPTNETKSKRVGVSKASPSERKAAVELFQALKAAGVKNFAEEAAKKYRVTERTINNWVRDADELEMQGQERSPTSVFSLAKQK